MIAFTSAAELEPHVGTVLGTSDWTTVASDAIAHFGRLTDDEHWIHVDRERAAREGPFGDVIAHGFLLLSLTTGLANQIYSVANATQWTNYGLDRVRFTAPVVAGSRVRLQLSLTDWTPTSTGYRIVLGCELQLEDSPRPALVSDWIVLIVEGAFR